MKWSLAILSIFLFSSFPHLGFSQESLEKSRAQEEILRGYLQDTQAALESHPEDLKLLMDFTAGNAFLGQWDEAVATYRSIRNRLEQVEREKLEGLLLYVRTGLIQNLTILPDPKGGGEYSFFAPYLLENPLEGSPEEVRDRKMENLSQGWELYRQGRYLEGREVLEGALSLEESSIGHFSLGLLIHQTGDPLEAIFHLEECLRLVGRDKVTAVFYATLAHAYINSYNFGGAVKTLREGLEIYPDHPFLLYSLSNIYRNTGSTENFVSTCEEIKAKDPVVFAFFEEECEKAKASQPITGDTHRSTF